MHNAGIHYLRVVNVFVFSIMKMFFLKTGLGHVVCMYVGHSIGVARETVANTIFPFLEYNVQVQTQSVITADPTKPSVGIFPSVFFEHKS